jgi:predicted aspartyl protease
MARWLVSVVLLLVPGLLRAAQEGPAGDARVLQCSARGLPVVDVDVDGARLRLGLDTGTSRTLISADAAERLHLVPRGRFSLATAGDASAIGLCAAVPNVRVAGIRLAADCLGWLPSERRLAGAEDLDGIFGADLLPQLDLWIDLGRCPVRARLAPPGSLAAVTDGTHLRIELIERRAVVDAEIAELRPPAGIRLVLDSGSNGLILFGQAAARLDVATRGLQTGARVESAVAVRDVAVAPIHGVRIGALRLDDVRAAGLLPAIVNRSEDGLVPLSALSPVLLDLSNRLVVARARHRR